MIFPEMVDELIKPIINDEDVRTTTMVDEVKTLDDFLDPNRVKVVLDLNSNAMLVTREPVPSRHKYKDDYTKYKHVAIRAYDRSLFSIIEKLPMSPMEKIEGIDDLRLIENGIKIRVVFTEHITETVDTQDDLSKVIDMMKTDELMKKYI